MGTQINFECSRPWSYINHRIHYYRLAFTGTCLTRPLLWLGSMDGVGRFDSGLVITERERLCGIREGCVGEFIKSVFGGLLERVV